MEEKVVKILDACTYLGGVGVFIQYLFGWLGSHAAGLTVLMTIATFLTSFYFQAKRDRREERLAQLSEQKNGTDI